MAISRRRMIYLAASVAGVAITSSATSNWLYQSQQSKEISTTTTTKKITTKPLTTDTILKSYQDNPYTEGRKSLVSIVLGTGIMEDVPKTVRSSVDLLGGLEKIDVSGKNVFVKPNTNSNNPHPASTNPAVVGTVVKMLFEAGAAEVNVGDCSNINNLTRDVMKDQGIQKAVEEAGGKVMFLEEMEYKTVKIPAGRWLTETRISKPVYEAERLVAIPIVKSHNVTGFSMSMKNFIGVIHKESRLDPEWRPSTKVFHACGNPAEAVAELNVLVKPDLIVMDGTKSLVSYGETDDSGEVRDTNIIIASGDRIANDIVGLSVIKSFGLWPDVMNRDVWEQGQITRGLELGLGRGKNDIKIVSRSYAGQDKLENLLQKIHSITEIEAG